MKTGSHRPRLLARLRHATLIRLNRRTLKFQQLIIVMEEKIMLMRLRKTHKYRLSLELLNTTEDC